MHGYSRYDSNYSHPNNDLYPLQARTTQNHALAVTIDDADEIDELVESSLQSNLNLIPELLVDYFPSPPHLPQVGGGSSGGNSPNNEPVNNSWPSCDDSTYDKDVCQQSTTPSHQHQYRYHPQQADSYRWRQPSSATTRAVIPNTSHVNILPTRKEKR
jgi:hypothetical protein